MVYINSNNATTISTEVTLNLSASDNVGVTAYFVSELTTVPDPNQNGWVSTVPSKNYNDNVSFTLSASSGLKTVNVWFKDQEANVSVFSSDSIIFNKTPPIIQITSAIPFITENSFPEFIFSSTKPGQIKLTGACSVENSNAVVDQNTVKLNFMEDGTYSDCSISVKDDEGFTSQQISLGPFTIKSSLRYPQISSGENFSCARLTNGSVQCWGAGDRGQLGNGKNEDQNEPVEVAELDNVVEVTTGESHACALINTGEIKCWGDGGYGRLGNGDFSNQNKPVNVKGITNAIKISAGGKHNCALLNDGQIKCWGSGDYGSLGNGPISGTGGTISENVYQIDTAIDVSAGWNHSCAVLADGSMKCWGSDSYGQIGAGLSRNQFIPLGVKTLITRVCLFWWTIHLRGYV